MKRWLQVVDGLIILAGLIYIVLTLATEITQSEFILLPLMVYTGATRGVIFQRNGLKISASLSYVFSSFLFVMLIYIFIT